MEGKNSMDNSQLIRIRVSIHMQIINRIGCKEVFLMYANIIPIRGNYGQ